ncbi:MAG: tol-pal system protein YbgF [Aestuariivirga sp.]|uniref:tol-pal system protein YbgF n=1 Tax=Aestuariivirga sp. TaxID=2650926 RepID=UPI0025BD4EAC|nr:tol-pal system protein YbgF [Aestuariivirga sp.]MCA3561205.1 tol-pal system protein YbgF [Aestuariivirga sp.]
MLKFVQSSAAAAALVGIGLLSPAMAQSASEMAVRVQQLEEQIRQLTGQVQELSFEVKQLRADGAAAPRQSGAAQPLKAAAPLATAAPQPAPAPEPSQQKRLAAASAGAPIPDSNGVATIEQAPLNAPEQTATAVAAMPPVASTETVQQDVPGAAPAARVFGALDNAAAQPNDGGFQGQVLVPPSQQEPGDDYGQQGAAAQPATGDDSIETVSLQPDAATQTETPESLYERSNESLLRRQYGDAEAGFSTFLSKYPDHSLAGSAQYWLGETYYAQNDYQRAAANFLQGYKKYPASRRAPDSLLKLGMSLNRLGQGDQACAALAAVSAEYPKAADARKRAQTEAKRVGCAS